MSTVPLPPLIPSDANVTGFQVVKPKVVKSVVTQADTTTTGVELNAAAGVITMVTSTQAADASISVIVTNSYCAVDSVVLVSVAGYDGTVTTSCITLGVETVASGAFTLNIGNGSAAVLDGILKVSFLIV